MKTYNVIYYSKERLQEYINNNIFVIGSGVLVQVFTYSTDKSYIEKVINDIKSLLKNARIIGSTTSGEIMDCSVLEKSTVISITTFEKTSVDTAYVEYDKNSFDCGVEIAKRLVKENTKVLILFSDGLKTNGDDILEGIYSVDKSIVVAGGCAADYGYMAQTYIFNEDKVFDKGVVGASLSGDIIVNRDYSFCWQTIGKIMTVTKSINGRVYTIDDIPVKKVYEKYLGKEVADSLPKSATEFPLIVYQDDALIGRVAFGKYSDDSLSFIGNIKEGAKVSFGYGDVDMVSTKSIEIFNRLKKVPIETIFVYSCTARRVFMQKKIDFELVPLRKFGPTAGFFTYGEFYHNKLENQLLNVTTTVLCLSESKDIRKVILQDDYLKIEHESSSFAEDKSLVIIRTLSYLAQTVTNELEDMNKSLAIKNKELKENQNKIVEIERMSSLGILASSIAHNLKTPLATVSSSIITLEKLSSKIKNTSCNSENDYIEYSDKISEISKRITSCLSYMSNIIMEVKAQTISCDTISIGFTVNELIERIKILIGDTVKGTKCTMNFFINISLDTIIKGNIASLVQVIDNLVSNAIDAYDGRGGNIDLFIDKKVTGDLFKTNESIIISIQDYGKGIDENIKNKIFNKMVTTKGTKGTGLGLFVSKSKIKSSFDGDITFTSGPDKTTFNIIIPV